MYMHVGQSLFNGATFITYVCQLWRFGVVELCVRHMRWKLQKSGSVPRYRPC